MSALISQLEAVHGKQAYQTYTIQHGIEQLKVLVPVKTVKTFEERFSKLADKQKASIVTLVEAVGGKVKG
jgi:hypothetical protein